MYGLGELGIGIAWHMPKCEVVEMEPNVQSPRLQALDRFPNDSIMQETTAQPTNCRCGRQPAVEGAKTWQIDVRPADGQVVVGSQISSGSWNRQPGFNCGQVALEGAFPDA